MSWELGGWVMVVSEVVGGFVVFCGHEWFGGGGSGGEEVGMCFFVPFLLEHL